MYETYTPRHPATATQVTLATRTLDGIDTLILTQGNTVEFYPVEDRFFTLAALEEICALSLLHQLAKEAPATPPPAPPVKQNALLRWLRMFSPRTPLKNSEIHSQRMAS